MTNAPGGLKVGRQELAYGDERLVGVSDWQNYARTFDAAKIIYKGHGFSVEAFTSTPVIITKGQYDQSNLFNGYEDHRDLVFSGAYLSFDSLPFGVWDVYGFVLDQANGNVGYAQGTLTTALPKGSLLDRSDFVTLGTRIKGDPKKLHGWEYSGEFAWQVGKVRDLNLNAYALNAGVGYNFLDTPWIPRIFAEYNYASGDDNPADRDIGTFQNLFPTNHKFYGIMDLFSWQNMEDAHLSVSVQPTKSLTAEVGYYAHWLANTNDAWVPRQRDHHRPPGQRGRAEREQLRGLRTRPHPHLEREEISPDSRRLRPLFRLATISRQPVRTTTPISVTSRPP